MAIEFVVWGTITGIAILGYTFATMFKVQTVFVLACALLIGSAALLWGSGGLLLSQQVSLVNVDTGAISYEDVVVSMSNIGLQMLAIAFVAVGVLSVFIFDFGGGAKVSRRNTYHY